jgi:hypothetical protein
VKKDYTVFVHFMKDDATLFQGDHQPPLPTSLWKVGELVGDRSCVAVPPGADLDGLLVVIGLADSGGSRGRLRMSGGSDRLELGPEGS